MSDEEPEETVAEDMQEEGGEPENETDTELMETEDEGEGEGRRGAGEGDEENLLKDEINITDSQVMIQLKEAEEEADALRKDIARLREEIEEYNQKEALNEADAAALSEKQTQLMEKLALLDEITKRIAKLTEFSLKKSGDEETTVLEEEEEEEDTLPDDILPRVVICSSWDDMMPKVVVCMDMKKPGAGKKMEDRDENGLTPEQREALEQERRCMAEERSRLQYQIAALEGEMRVMVRENEMLSKKVAQLKADAENQPPFEFEMSVSATQPPGCGGPKPGNMDMGIGVMGPKPGGNYCFGGTLAPGAEMTGTMNVQPNIRPPSSVNADWTRRGSQSKTPQNGVRLPCGGPLGIPGKAVPCPMMEGNQQGCCGQTPQAVDVNFPPYGKKCRKDFNAGVDTACPCAGGRNGCSSQDQYGAMGISSYPEEEPNSSFPFKKQPPMDLNFKVNVQPQSAACGGPNDIQTVDASQRSNKIAQQLQEIEMEVKRMQRELNKAKSDKETLRAQQAALTCARNSLI